MDPEADITTPMAIPEPVTIRKGPPRPKYSDGWKVSADVYATQTLASGATGSVKLIAGSHLTDEEMAHLRPASGCTFDGYIERV